jgi:hypothetical protein
LLLQPLRRFEPLQGLDELPMDTVEDHPALWLVPGEIGPPVEDDDFIPVDEPDFISLSRSNQIHQWNHLA